MDGEPYTGGMAKRVAFRRHQLGLTLEQVACRAGTSPAYVENLERGAVIAHTDALPRLAAALETRVAFLLGVDLDGPPGARSVTNGRSRIDKLDAGACMRLLAAGGVGRVVYVSGYGPEALPVNFAVLGGAITFRTAGGGVLAHLVGHRVGFEVDRLDEALSRGWSVLVSGEARRITDRRLADRVRAAARPWPDGVREVAIAIDPDRITGRRIGAEGRGARTATRRARSGGTERAAG